MADNGGWAFPTGDGQFGGMSLRDYFAAHAPEPGAEWINEQISAGRAFDEVLATHAYEYADAMLKAREPK